MRTKVGRLRIRWLAAVVTVLTVFAACTSPAGGAAPSSGTSAAPAGPASAAPMSGEPSGPAPTKGGYSY
jgi:hypothetical protein